MWPFRTTHFSAVAGCFRSDRSWLKKRQILDQNQHQQHHYRPPLSVLVVIRGTFESACDFKKGEISGDLRVNSWLSWVKASRFAALSASLLRFDALCTISHLYRFTSVSRGWKQIWLCLNFGGNYDAILAETQKYERVCWQQTISDSWANSASALWVDVPQPFAGSTPLPASLHPADKDVVCACVWKSFSALPDSLSTCLQQWCSSASWCLQ